jgi:hypothetical protein
MDTLPPKSIPTTYRGTRFRSKLEACWAATFDTLGWYWEYEPCGFTFAYSYRYLCDFYLPQQRAWFECKAPGGARRDKANALAKRLGEDELVIIGYPAGPGEHANWIGVRDRDMPILRCGICHAQAFTPPLRHRHDRKPVAVWRCRVCDCTDALIPESRISPSAAIEAARREKGEDYAATYYQGLPFAAVRGKGAA